VTSIETRAVRVAALAAALVEDRQRPASPRVRPAEKVKSRKWWDPAETVLSLVRDEQARLGEEVGKRRRSSLEWLMALAVEMGALAEEVADPAKPEGHAHDACEALQHAARSAVAWVDGTSGRPAT
jgi:hypothetical protein